MTSDSGVKLTHRSDGEAASSERRRLRGKRILGTLAVLPSCVAWCAASVTSHLRIGRGWATNQHFWVEVRAMWNPLSQLCPNLKWIGEVWSFQQSLAKTSNLLLAPPEFIVNFERGLFKSRKTERCKKYYSRSCMTYCKLKVVLYTC